LFATGDSHTSARLVPQIPKALNFDAEVEASAYHLAALQEAYSRANEFDIVHSHLDYLTLPFAATTQVPTVITLHGRIDRDEFRRAYAAFSSDRMTASAAHYVAISESQRRYQANLNWIATIHHGIDVRSFPYYSTPENYLCFMGRISPEKGPERAIQVAKRVGVPLKIAAKIGPNDRAYFTEVIAPLLDDPLIEFLGELDETSKRDLMGNALALLLPIDWPEPFGLVFIEALACGTPVITSRRGSAPELLREGVTAYFGDTVDDLVEAVYRLPRIKRTACRREALERFDTRRMAMEYARIYTGLSEASPADAARPMLPMESDVASATLG
jgi:glycosyltransferase involved in cell wall biosynthesis